MGLQLVVDKTTLEHSITPLRWRGVATFLTEEMAAVNEAFTLQGTIHPKAVLPPLAYFSNAVIEFRPYGIPDQALVRAYYDSGAGKTPGSPGNQATLHILVQSERVKPTSDLHTDGSDPKGPYPIDGYDITGTQEPGTFWKVVHGSAEQIQYRCVLRLDTAVKYTDFHLNEILALYDTVNKDALPKLGINKPGVLRFLGMGKEVAVRLAGGGQGGDIEVSYLFGYDPDGWNGSVNGAVMHGVCLRPGTFTPTPVATYDTAGAETGTRNILVWQPKTGTGVEPDRVFAASKTVGAFLYPEGDFSKLHALATW